MTPYPPPRSFPPFWPRGDTHTTRARQREESSKDFKMQCSSSSSSSSSSTSSLGAVGGLVYYLHYSRYTTCTGDGGGELGKVPRRGWPPPHTHTHCCFFRGRGHLCAHFFPLRSRCLPQAHLRSNRRRDADSSSPERERFSDRCRARDFPKRSSGRGSSRDSNPMAKEPAACKRKEEEELHFPFWKSGGRQGGDAGKRRRSSNPLPTLSASQVRLA